MCSTLFDQIFVLELNIVNERAPELAIFHVLNVAAALAHAILVKLLMDLLLMNDIRALFIAELLFDQACVLYL